MAHFSWKRSADCMPFNRYYLIQEGPCNIKSIHMDFLDSKFFHNIKHTFFLKVFLNIGFHTSL